jgi:Flp pilus assembly protein TadG
MAYMKNERGQSLVELAVSLVILLYLLSGAVEFGILFFQYVQLRDAAQEGALYGSTHPYFDANGNGDFDVGEQNIANVDEIKERARGSSPTNSPLDLNDPAVTIAVTSSVSGGLFCEDATAGYGIRVTVSYPHHVFMPFLCPVFRICDIALEATVVDTILTPKCP